MTDRISQRFQAADQDGSGDISQVEFADALAGQGIGDATAQKVFSQLDADGDGLVTQAEQRAGVESIASRLQEYAGQPGAPQPMQALTSLLDAIASSAEDADTSSEAQTLLQQLQTSGPAGETVSEV
ncbi:MAG: EF-hand domain-containing protein, partial [Pseudomonadota bacterium]